MGVSFYAVVLNNNLLWSRQTQINIWLYDNIQYNIHKKKQKTLEHKKHVKEYI